MTTTENDFATELSAGLRSLADMIDANPDLAEQWRYLNATNIPIGRTADPRAVLADFIRAGLRHGSTIDKEQDDNWAGATLAWGPFGIHVYAARELVCERVVTGVETVTKSVPDPKALAAVPTVEVTEEVERVEWVCAPLLADAAAAEAVAR